MSPSLFRRATLVSALSVLVPAVAHAAEYYVSPSGSDSAAGSSAAPFATLSKANGAAAAGDTIWVHGGTYYITSQLTLSKSGTSDSNRTKIWAVAGETPVLDISRYNTTNSAADVPAVLVTGSWMHLRGLEIANAKVGASGDHSYSLLRTKNSSNNTFELLNLHHGFGPGLFIDTGNGGNLILNCDSHDNYDANGSQGDGQNADGFGIHYQTSGPSSVIRGCRAWNNSDDGYDFISQEVPVTIEDSFGISNGRGSSGNGNGFKIGSSQNGIRHIVRNNVAWKNKDKGFYANHSTGGNTWYNNTSYMNGTQYDMLASSFDSSGNVTGTITLSGAKAHIMRNNIGFPNKNANMTGVDTMFNTWDLNITEASTDFASTSDTGCTGPREANGDMPAACTFMHLKSGSPLIDKGTNVQLPYVGSAPDLGAYEFGATTTGTGGAGGGTGTGGAGGAAGTTGAAGRGGTTGTGGIAGRSGARGGTTGTAGIGGVTGIAGRGGTTGTAGTGGVTGTAGRGGTTGTAGTGGSSAGRGGTSGGGTSGGGGSTVAPDWLSSIAVVYQFDQPSQGQLGVEAHGNNALHLEEQGTFLPVSDMTNFIEGYSVNLRGTLANTTYLQTSTGGGLPSVFKTDATNSWTAGGWFRITTSGDQQWLLHTEGPTSFEQGGFYFYVNQNPGKLSLRTAYAYCRVGVKESTGNYKEIATDNQGGIGDLGFDPVVGNSWVHLTCRYNAATNELSILVGGVTQASNVDVVHGVASGPGPFMIGCNESWGCSLTGNADEVFFATSALSDVAVHRIYACGIDGSRCRCNGISYNNCGLLQSASCPMLPGCNATVP